MKLKKLFISGLKVIILITLSLPCFGQSSNSFSLKRWSISSAGGALSSSSYLLKESALGGIATGKSFSNSFSLNGGMLITTIKDSSGAYQLLPLTFELQQNYPNPFNPETTIRYSLSKRTDVSIRIFNLMGQVIKTFEPGQQEAGQYDVRWDGKDNAGLQAASGNYYYQIIAEGFSDVKKMILLR